MNPIFRAKTKPTNDGTLDIAPHTKNKIRDHVLTFDGDTELEIIIRNPQVIDDDWLRRYYFGYVATIIAKETGNSVSDIHEHGKMEFATIIEKGIKIKQPVFSRKSKMSFDQKKQFISEVRLWAFHDLQITTPDIGEVDV